MALGTAAAILGSAAIGALTSGHAASKAASASQDATNQSLALQQQQFAQTQANLAPYQQAGQTGLGSLTDRVNNPDAGNFSDGGFQYTADDYHKSPGYQFQLDQGINAINSSQSAKGALGSGATLKALQSYGQGLADQDFQQGYNNANAAYQDQRAYQTNRYDTATGTAGNLATIGANAAAGASTAGMNFANNSSNILNTNATTQGNAGLAAAGNVNSLLGTGVNALAYQNGQTGIVNALLAKAGAAGGAGAAAATPLTNGMFVG